uniref:Uncharacterized protein n=1 Tax=Romanomermis culicivorax TaxID=13658 RepID=A0A915ILC1_ROMCU
MHRNITAQKRRDSEAECSMHAEDHALFADYKLICCYVLFVDDAVTKCLSHLFVVSLWVLPCKLTMLCYSMNALASHLTTLPARKIRSCFQNLVYNDTAINNEVSGKLHGHGHGNRDQSNFSARDVQPIIFS